MPTESNGSTWSKGPAGGENRDSKSARRRAEILAKAIQLFAERGVSTSLRMIGEAIGVSHAALRYYFASRDDLLIEVYRTHETQLSRPSAPEDVSAVQVMETSAEQNRTIPGLVELYATLTTDALDQSQHPAAREFIADRFIAVRNDLADRVRAGQQTGAIAADIDPEDAAALICAASDGLQLQWLLDPERVDVRQALTILERIFPSAND